MPTIVSSKICIAFWIIIIAPSMSWLPSSEERRPSSSSPSFKWKGLSCCGFCCSVCCCCGRCCTSKTSYSSALLLLLLRRSMAVLVVTYLLWVLFWDVGGGGVGWNSTNPVTLYGSDNNDTHNSTSIRRGGDDEDDDGIVINDRFCFAVVKDDDDCNSSQSWISIAGIDEDLLPLLLAWFIVFSLPACALAFILLPNLFVERARRNLAFAFRGKIRRTDDGCFVLLVPQF